MAEVDARELRRIVKQIEEAPGWRVEHMGGFKYRAFPADPNLPPITLGRHPHARSAQNMYADLRNAGIECDPVVVKNGRKPSAARIRQALPADPIPDSGFIYDREREEYLPAPTPGWAPKPPPPLGPGRFVIPPEAKTWGFSLHARERMDERLITAEEIYATIYHPDSTKKEDDGRVIYRRHDVEVVTNSVDRTVVTVIDCWGSVRDEPRQSQEITLLAPEAAKPVAAKPAPPKVVAVPQERKPEPLMQRAVSPDRIKELTTRTMQQANEPNLGMAAPPSCVFRFEEPPANRPRGPRVISQQQQEWLEAALPFLRQRPGDWALLREYESRGTAASTKRRLKTLWPMLEFRAHSESPTKAHPKGASRVYVRWPAK